MNSAFLLQIIAIAIGGGTVQLTIFLLKRRAELRSLDAASDATLLNSANAYIVTLQAGDKALRVEVDSLKAEIAELKEGWTRDRLAMRAEWDVERNANTEALENANRQVARFLSDLARVRTDLQMARAEIAELETRFK